MSPQISNSISYMRFIALWCILSHHSFCVYSGWPPNLDVILGLPDSFQVLSSVCKGIGLVSFCMISGMLVSYSFTKYNSNKNIYDNWSRFIIKKFKRLIIPAIVWGVVYALFFNRYMLHVHFPSFINGTHLWFLPMLFLLMLGISPVVFNRALWVIPLFMYICFFLNPFSRTTNEFVNYFPSFVCGYFFYRLIADKGLHKLNIKLNIKDLLYKAFPIIGCITVYFLLSKYYDFYFSYAIYLISVIVLLTVFNHLTKQLSRFFELKAAKFATKESFTIYIVHQFVIILLSFLDIPILSSASVASVLIYFIACFCCSSVIAYILSSLREKYRLIEFVA